MYSEMLLDVFKDAGIRIGDVISLQGKGTEFTGELMPKTEVGNPDIVVLKLESGYNAGIRYEKGVTLKKISSGKPAGAFPKARIKSSGDLPKVAWLYTGGTIGSKVDYRTGGVYMLLKPEELFYEVPELASIANISSKPLFSISSEDMSYLEWQKMADETAKALASGARGVVITMGTDTMHYASAALSFMLKGVNAPVVVTGAQRSSDRGSSDAFMNLTASMRIAAESDIAGVGICMHGSSSDTHCDFIRGTKARKMHTSRRDAFRPINDRRIARVDQAGHISHTGTYERLSPDKRHVKAVTGFEDKVALLKVHPNSDPEVLDFYSDRGYRGVVLEGTGLGHAPVSTEHKDKLWLPHIKRATDSGMIIGMTSQCIYGRVNDSVYRNLRLLSNAGVVYCEDMTPETAYVKLGWLLGNYDAAEAKAMLAQNLTGEISKRSEFDEFLD